MAADLWDVRTQMKTQAEGITGGGFTLHADRTVLGYDDLTATTDFWAALSGTGSATAGPFLLIRPGDIADWDHVTQHATFEIPCDLWLAITRETDNTFQNPEALLTALKVVWAGKSMTARLERPLDLKKSPIPVHYEILVTAPGC